MEQALCGHPYIRCDRWDGVQKTAQHPVTARAHLQQYLEDRANESASSDGRVPIVLHLVGSHSPSLHDSNGVVIDDLQNVVYIQAKDGPSLPFDCDPRLGQYHLLRPVPLAESVAELFSCGVSRIGEVLHPAVTCTLQEWWPQKRTLQLDVTFAPWKAALDLYEISKIGSMEDFTKQNCARKLFTGATAGLGAMLKQYYAAPGAATHFFRTTLSTIVRIAQGLPRVPQPLDVQSAGEISLTEISTQTAAAIVANMYLCVWPGPIEEVAGMTSPSNFGLLWHSTAAEDVQKLWAVTHYFECIGSGSMQQKDVELDVESKICINRCVLRRH
eukprot:SAG31_NODE_7578_length_1649_cov_0.858710_2_plen_328_part_01